MSPPSVLSLTAANHAADDRFNLYWSPDTNVANGTVAVAVRADGGVVAAMPEDELTARRKSRSRRIG